MSAQLFKAISEIDPDLINACEFESIRHPHKKRWIAAAACLLFLFSGGWLIHAASATASTGSSSGIQSSVSSPEKSPDLVWNTVVQHVDVLQDALYFFEEDGVEMSNDEVLAYFHLNLPVSETLPELTPYHPNPTWAQQRYFIFNSDGEAMYDQRVFGFQNSDDTKRILVNVSYWKAPVFFPDPNRTTACRQSNINGIGVTLFHDAFYTAAPYNLPAVKNIDADRYETALFVSIQLDDLTLTIGGDGVSEDEFVRVIEAILKANPSHTTSMVAADTVQTKTGYVEFTAYREMPDIWFFILRVDEEYLVDGKYTNMIWECTPEEWQASGLQVGDRISFSYRGNPFNTIAIWKEQQIELKKLES